MKKIKIYDSKDYITANFQRREFRNTKYGGYKDFEMFIGLADGVQILRDHFKVPIKITSVLRTKDTFGFHRTGEALDCVMYADPLKYIELFKIECQKYREKKGSILIEALRSVGIAGFGMESGCIHIDCRQSVFNANDKFGGYCIFSW